MMITMDTTIMSSIRVKPVRTVAVDAVLPFDLSLHIRNLNTCCYEPYTKVKKENRNRPGTLVCSC